MALSPANSKHAKQMALDLADPLAVLTNRGVGQRLADEHKEQQGKAGGQCRQYAHH